MPLNGGIMGQATGPQKDRLQLVHNQSFWFLANWAAGNWTDHNWLQLATAVQLRSVVVQSSCQSLHQLPTGLRNPIFLLTNISCAESSPLFFAHWHLYHRWLCCQDCCYPANMFLCLVCWPLHTPMHGQTGSFQDLSHCYTEDICRRGFVLYRLF